MHNPKGSLNTELCLSKFGGLTGCRIGLAKEVKLQVKIAIKQIIKIWFSMFKELNACNWWSCQQVTFASGPKSKVKQ